MTVDWVLEQFIVCGGKPSIRYEHRPHLGSNRLPMIVRNFRRKIEALDEAHLQQRRDRAQERGGRKELAQLQLPRATPRSPL